MNHSSVRISSQAVYNTGLFVLDLDMAPWGCGPCFFFPIHTYFSNLSLRCMACLLVFNEVFFINFTPDIIMLLGPWEMVLGHGYVYWPS